MHGAPPDDEETRFPSGKIITECVCTCIYTKKDALPGHPVYSIYVLYTTVYR
jgi:hypothetical protein